MIALRYPRLSRFSSLSVVVHGFRVVVPRFLPGYGRGCGCGFEDEVVVVAAVDGPGYRCSEAGGVGGHSGSGAGGVGGRVAGVRW